MITQSVIFVLSFTSSLYFFPFFFFISFPVCEGECRTPAWQIGKLPNDKVNSNSDDNKKTQTSNTGTEKQQREVQINISRVGTRWYTGREIDFKGERGGGGLRYDCRGWMETIKQHSKGGTVVTQQWCRYVTKPKHTTRRACVCI